MVRGGWRWRVCAVGSIVAVLAAGCGVSTPEQVSVAEGCSVSAKLVPTCGVLWGVATRPHQASDVATLEGQVGRKFDFVYRYHDITGVIPDGAERDVAADGHYLHLSIVATDFSSSNPHTVSWADVAAGKYDAQLRQQGKGIASLHVPVFVTFDHEANQTSRLARGSGEDFKRAWRHVHEIYTEAGATNAVWVWVMMGWDQGLVRAGQLWPGNDVVDWISWDVYNQSGCRGAGITDEKYVSFADKMLIFYRWVHATGPSIGMDPDKPMMISEAGSAQYPGDAQKTADWYASIPSVLEKYPQIKAIGLWDSRNGKCDYRFQKNPEILKAVRKAGADPRMEARVAPPTDRQSAPAR